MVNAIWAQKISHGQKKKKHAPEVHVHKIGLWIGQAPSVVKRIGFPFFCSYGSVDLGCIHMLQFLLLFYRYLPAPLPQRVNTP